jgi:DNA-directed RNA polymerase subunit RPC12/RpoP
MVKVVGGGYKKRCDNCGRELEFTRSDVRAGKEIPGSDDRDHSSVIACPACRHSVDVTSVVGSASYETADRQRMEEQYDY